ncbi:N-acetylglucosamine-6-phosphate deacetylase [Kineococcus rhizosphaerae]|uniref:N-acetylglucosamine-6-phosphate deacetylase n=1 Tax=Kineococcus rhizosphaerae TaxID=559628 RepID=A0A2T0R1Z6_9ACTN|nr:amidohydrolase family protein [Kineococcus rhizosphaerae]PRY13541.1 N-acetylglucosamine-6-phosphate deacetylase [Kineococcus rhizosphaerae]
MTVLARGAVRTGTRTAEWVLLDGPRVLRTGTGPAPAADEVVDGAHVVPGFVDVHCHGGGGVSFGGSVEDALTVAATHRAHGTTTIVASLVTRPVDELARTLDAYADLVADGVLAGIHLEGPWLSPDHRGAHDASLLRAPEAGDLDRLLRPGLVAMVTVAPELEGGLAAVQRIAAAGAVAAIGHTDADADLTRRAVDAGATWATHLFNAMPPVHHRAPGPVAALLEDERVTVELIADGVHLHPLVLSLAAHRAGRGRVAFVTDAMAATGSADGRYRLGDLDVDVVDGVARLAGGGSIAGSTLTLDRALAFAVAAGLDLDDALAALTAVPARALGRPDVGHLEPGARGGAVVLADDLTVVRVLT